MNRAVDKATRLAGTAAALAGVAKLVVTAEWSEENGQIQKVKLFGFIPVFDRARMEARRARRAAKKG